MGAWNSIKWFHNWTKIIVIDVCMCLLENRFFFPLVLAGCIHVSCLSMLLLCFLFFRLWFFSTLCNLSIPFVLLAFGWCFANIMHNVAQYVRRMRYIKIISCWLTFMPSSIIIGHDRRTQWRVKEEAWIRYIYMSVLYVWNAKRCFSTTIPELFIIWPSE